MIAWQRPRHTFSADILMEITHFSDTTTTKTIAPLMEDRVSLCSKSDPSCATPKHRPADGLKIVVYVCILVFTLYVYNMTIASYDDVLVVHYEILMS